MIPFRAMSATSEAPAAFRNAAGPRVRSRCSARASPTSAPAAAWCATSSRRTCGSAARTRSSATSGGSSIRSSRWSSTSIFVSIIARGHGIEDYPLFIFAAILPWKWFTAVGHRRDESVVSQDRLIKQIPFPKLVLPVAATTAGVVGFALGLVPLGRLLLLLRDRLRLTRPARSRSSRPCSTCSRWRWRSSSPRRTSSSATSATCSATSCACGGSSRPGLYSLACSTSVNVVRDIPDHQDPRRANPFAVLFEAYRAVIYGTLGPARPRFPDWISLAFLGVGSLLFLGVTIVIFKRVEPDFAKVL